MNIKLNRNKFNYAKRIKNNVNININVGQKKKTYSSGNTLVVTKSVDNISVDDNIAITCIIDWTSTTIVPPVEMLAAPRLLT